METIVSASTGSGLNDNFLSLNSVRDSGGSRLNILVAFYCISAGVPLAAK
jgi:hypothetical protein